MNKLDRREVLSRVAAGTISPEEAATQLDSISQDEAVAEPAVRKVRIERQLGSLEVVGDPTVREAVAVGPHQARIDGDVMVFEGPGVAALGGGFFFGIGGSDGTDKLMVRLNPALALDLQLQAGNCRVTGVEGPIRAEIQAGSAAIEGFKSELNVSVQAGSLKASGRLDGGESRIVCDAGSVNLNLERGSSVRIRSRANMGKVELPGAPGAPPNSASQEVTIGDGAGSLTIESHLGSVKVSVAGG